MDVLRKNFGKLKIRSSVRALFGRRKYPFKSKRSCQVRLRLYYRVEIRKTLRVFKKTKYFPPSVLFSKKPGLFVEETSCCHEDTWYPLDTEKAEISIDLLMINDKCCSESYLKENLSYEINLEYNFALKKKYRPPGLCLLRENAVEWLISLSFRLDFPVETLHLAVAIFDKIISLTNITEITIQKIAITSLMIAIKLEHPLHDIPKVNYYALLTEKLCNASELKGIERNILAALKFNLSFPTSVKFLGIFNAIIRASLTEIIISQYLLDISLMNHKTCQIRPSLQAVAASCLARAIWADLPDIEFVWMITFQEIIPYEWKLVRSVIEQFLSALQIIGASGKGTAVFKKYGQNKLSGVSTLEKLKTPNIIFDVQNDFKKVCDNL